MVEPTYSGADAARASATPVAQTSGSSTNSEVAFDVFVKNISAASNEARLALSQKLKEADIWTGSPSSKFDIKYYTALTRLEEKYQGQLALDKIIGTTTPTQRYDVLANIISGADGQGSSGSSTSKQTYITSASQTAKLLNTVAVDLLERNLTKAEQAKYLKIINDAQRKQPSVQTQSDGSSVTMGGVDEQQLITEKLQATPEAQRVRATDAYTVLMQELGGLR
jgi:hypothetical protein